MHQVFTSASAVSYYDGDTLLGVEEVDEGLDVLRPSIDTSKDGYTLVGWTGYGGTERFEEKVADGEPMSLYAMYLPNTLVVLTTTISGWSHDSAGWHVYTSKTYNSKYVNGETEVKMDATWSGQYSSIVTFTVNKGFYSKAISTINVQHTPQDVGSLDWGNGRLDGVLISKGNSTHELANGNHTLQSFAQSYGDYRETVLTCVTDITLSDPIPWT